MCSYRGRRIGNFGAAETFSFHSSALISAAEGGSIVTNDDALANKLRTIRNFYVPAERVALRINGKMAEAPAALALLGIEDLPSVIKANAGRYLRYAEKLRDVVGISVVDLTASHVNNYQSVILRVDQAVAGTSAAELNRALARYNVLCDFPLRRVSLARRDVDSRIDRGLVEFPVANAISESLLQLPSGQAVLIADIDRICSLIRSICEKSEHVNASRSSVP